MSFFLNFASIIVTQHFSSKLIFYAQQN